MRLLSIAAVLLCLANVQAAEVLHADFEPIGDETAPDGWTFRRARGECFGQWDQEQAAGGLRSARLAIPTDTGARAHWAYTRRVPVEPSTGYRLRVKMMLAEVTGEAYVICYENGQEVPDHWHDTPHLSGSRDWHEQAIEFRTRPDAEWLVVVCKLRHGTGYAWFDDLTIEQAEIPPAERVRVVPEDDGFPLQALWTPAQWTRQEVLHLLPGRINPLSVFFWGDKAKVTAPAIVIETPRGITLHGPVVRGRGPTARDVETVPTAVERDGESLLSWRFEIPGEPLTATLRDRPSWDGYHHLYAEVAPDATSGGHLRWRLETGGQLGPEHALALQVAAPLEGKLTPPEDFRIYVQHTGALRTPNATVRRGLVEYLQAAGIVGGLCMSYYEPQRVDFDAHLQSLGFDLHTWRFEGFAGTAEGETALVNVKGETVAGHVCPEAQLQRVQPWYDSVRAHYEAKLIGGIKRLVIDYEPSTFNTCFCPRCRAAFARRFELSAEECATLPGAELQAKYGRQWGRFCAEQHGAIVKLHIALIHEIDSEVAVGLCSWHGTAAFADRGADITLFEPDTAFHAPMIYTSGPGYHQAVKETCERTGRPVLPFIELSDISQPRSLSPRELRENLLATGLCGGGGAFMWVGIECFDADYMHAIARSVRDIRLLRSHVPFSGNKVEWLQVEGAPEQVREITVDGRRIAVPSSTPFGSVRCHVWGNDEKAVVALLSYDETEAQEVRVSLSKPGRAGYTVLDLSPGADGGAEAQGTLPDSGYEVSVGPGDLTALIVSNNP